MSTDTAHSWVRARFAARATGVLPPEVDERVAAHLGSCSACRRLWEEYADEQPEAQFEGAHLPASLIAHWSEAPLVLRGLARAMVRTHLERCAACREDLRLLGHTDPVAQLDAAVEPAPVPRTARPAGDTLSRTFARHRAPSSRRLAWWGLGGWAVLATAAALTLAVLPRGERPGQQHTLVVPWVTPALVRGAGADAVLEVPPEGARAIVAVAVPVGLPASSTAQIRIYAPEDVLLVAVPLTLQDLQRRTVMIQLDLPPHAPSGVYRVVLTAQQPGAPAPESIERFFEVRAAVP